MSEHSHTDQKADKQQEPAQRQESTPMESAALAGNPMYDTLHQSIGNRAVGRLLETQRAAANEKPMRVSPEQQRQIEDGRGGGLPLEGAPGVRLHYGDNAQALSRGLNARAFTQGSDIFFGEDYDPNSEAGQNTMAHELTHAKRGEAVAGSVQREPNKGGPVFASTEPNQSVDKRYDLTLDSGTFKNLTAQAALAKLAEVENSINHAIAQGSGEHGIIAGARASDFFTVLGATLVEMIGDKFPPPTIWNAAKDALAKAQVDLKEGKVVEAVSDLTTASDEYVKASKIWEGYKEQLQPSANTTYLAIIFVAVLAIYAVAEYEAAEVATAGGERLAGEETAAGTEAGGTRLATAEERAAAEARSSQAPASSSSPPSSSGPQSSGPPSSGAPASTPRGPVSEPPGGGGNATVPNLDAEADAANAMTQQNAFEAYEAGAKTGNRMSTAYGDEFMSSTEVRANWQSLERAYAEGGADAVRAQAQTMSPEALDSMMSHVSFRTIGNAPATLEEMRGISEMYNVVEDVWHETAFGAP